MNRVVFNLKYLLIILSLLIVMWRHFCFALWSQPSIRCSTGIVAHWNWHEHQTIITNMFNTKGRLPLKRLEMKPDHLTHWLSRSWRKDKPSTISYSKFCTVLVNYISSLLKNSPCPVHTALQLCCPALRNYAVDFSHQMNNICTWMYQLESRQKDCQLYLFFPRT